MIKLPLSKLAGMLMAFAIAFAFTARSDDGSKTDAPKTEVKKDDAAKADAEKAKEAEAKAKAEEAEAKAKAKEAEAKAKAEAKKAKEEAKEAEAKAKEEAAKAKAEAKSKDKEESAKKDESKKDVAKKDDAKKDDAKKDVAKKDDAKKDDAKKSAAAADHNMTQAQAALALVDKLGLFPALPNAPTALEAAAALTAQGISPFDGWKLDETLKIGDFAKILVEALGRSNEIPEADKGKGKAYVDLLKGMGINVESGSDALDEVDVLAEIFNAAVDGASLNSDPLRNRTIYGRPDEMVNGTDAAFGGPVTPAARAAPTPPTPPAPPAPRPNRPKPPVPSTRS